MTVSVKNALLASIILACMTSKGQAHDDYSMIKADCDSLQLTTGSGVNTQLEIGAFGKILPFSLIRQNPTLQKITTNHTLLNVRIWGFMMMEIWWKLRLIVTKPYLTQ